MRKTTVGVLAALGALAAAWPLSGRADDSDAVARGKYLVTIMDCIGCHTDGYLVGKPDPDRYLAGSSIGFGGPDGIVYPSNLTSHRENGIGAWSDEEIIAAIRAGQRPDGRTLAPVMPWPNYASLTDGDARAIVAYLRTVPANDYRPPRPVAAGQKAPSPYMVVRPADGTDETS
ncbi:MAG TPA: cytochrome c [Woeseiaceae bacterium]|nr:cytochrome c [Woeseiaceae bacterium]